MNDVYCHFAFVISITDTEILENLGYTQKQVNNPVLFSMFSQWVVFLFIEIFLLKYNLKKFFIGESFILM